MSIVFTIKNPFGEKLSRKMIHPYQDLYSNIIILKQEKNNVLFKKHMIMQKYKETRQPINYISSL